MIRLAVHYGPGYNIQDPLDVVSWLDMAQAGLHPD